MRKQNRFSHGLLKKFLFVHLSVFLTLSICSCGAEKEKAVQPENVESESTEFSKKEEGENKNMTTAEMEKVFENVVPKKAYKGIGNHNPVMTQRYGADPYALVYDGRVYLYMTCDEPMLDANGEINEMMEEELPYDVNASTIELEDDDFGLWYLDASEHPEKYVNKTMIFKGQVYRNRTFPSNAFVPARAAMTCCADDIAKIGFICHFDQAAQFDTNSWVRVKAQVKAEFSRKNQGMYPVLYADSVEKAEPPAEEVVYFS